MTVPRLREMNEYWKDNPPLHIMVAAYFGINSDKKQTEDEVPSLLDMFPKTMK